MNKNNILKFESKEIILQKTEVYMDDPKLFWDEEDKAVPIFFKALKYADSDTKRSLIIHLGLYTKQRQKIAEPFFRMITDPEEDIGVRDKAATLLTIILPDLENSQPFIDNLIEDTRNPDATQRSLAAALGWEGNTQAVVPLIELIYDKTPVVQENAINSLFNIGDDRILNLLLDRLEHAELEQKRIILFNLWRFKSKKEEVIPVYKKYLIHDNADLRFDALACLGVVLDKVELMDIYRKCFKDSSPKVRRLAISQIGKANPEEIADLKDEIEELFFDPDFEVMLEAMIIFDKIERECKNIKKTN